ncbi:hypothetical protein D3C87_1835710 [compost metagenome]
MAQRRGNGGVNHVEQRGAVLPGNGVKPIADMFFQLELDPAACRCFVLRCLVRCAIPPVEGKAFRRIPQHIGPIGKVAGIHT